VAIGNEVIDCPANGGAVTMPTESAFQGRVVCPKAAELV